MDNQVKKNINNLWNSNRFLATESATFKSKEKPLLVLNKLSVVSGNLDRECNELPSIFSDGQYDPEKYLCAMTGLAWVFDERANLIYGNPAFFDFFSLDEKISVNKEINQLGPGFETTRLSTIHCQVLSTGQPVETVEKMKWADGTSITFHVNIFPTESKEGRKCVGGNAIRLEDKYPIEKQLLEANNRLLNLTRATCDAIWEWDMQSNTIFRNEALLDMIGYPVESRKGLSWWLHRIHPEDRNRVSDKVKDTTEQNLQSWEAEYRFRRADNSYIHVRDRGFVVYENGLPVRMIGSIHDISNLKELENLLTEGILQRQKEISETVIRVQEKERTRIGHELHDNVNQIISTTRLFVDMLTPADKKQKEIKTKCKDYLLLAIEEIRKLSKELVVPELDHEGLVKSIKLLIDDVHLATDIKIKFAHDHESDLASSGKRITLFRIIQEQIKNIITYAEASSIDILLLRKNDDIKLTIKDDGKGFDPKQISRGIGLSNIHERTRFYGGTVDIQTAPGKGCCMNISIPLIS